MREHGAIKIGHFSIFKLNFLYQKSTEALWKWFSYFNMWIVEQLWLLTYYHTMKFCSTLFCKNVPMFWWLCAHCFWKIWKNHLGPLNMDLKDYSILDAFFKTVLPWIIIFLRQSFNITDQDCVTFYILIVPRKSNWKILSRNPQAKCQLSSSPIKNSLHDWWQKS